MMDHLGKLPSSSVADVYALFNDAMASNYLVRVCVDTCVWSTVCLY